ncbi:MAG: DUF6090 family protein [Saprospiraceae bacterium]
MKFFRAFRQTMMAQNKIINYFKYAIGEILLVVIGILIAFQVNEWGQNKKNLDTEISLLQEISSNLKEDSIQIEDILDQRMMATHSVSRMLAGIPHRNFDRDTFRKDLSRFLTWDRYYPINNAHEMLKSSGLRVSNRSLGSKISRYFDFLQQQQVLVTKDIEIAVNEILFHKDIMSKQIIYFDWRKDVQVANAYDPVFLRELNYQLTLFRDNNHGTTRSTVEFRTANYDLLQDVRTELEKLKSKL